MSEKIRIAAVRDVPPGIGKEFVVGERVIALYNVDGTFHALDGICPHAGGPLANGKLAGAVVTCPWHGWQFNVTTGRHCLSPGICQDVYVVTVEGDDVFVELPAKQ
jgi:nitrite reductase/ring-hydroxylating ferredoxin subunit